jgi:lysophospholipase L1-like esterase
MPEYGFNKLANTRRIEAVLMGNSITDNWAKFDPEFFIRNKFVGRGISGQTTAQMLSRFQADVIALDPKMVIIMAGTNDIAQNNG